MMPKPINKELLDAIKTEPAQGSSLEFLMGDGLPDVWSQAVSGGIGRIATLPQLAQARIAYPDEDVWTKKIATRSEEYLMRDHTGRFYKKNEKIVVITHGISFLQPSMLRVGRNKFVISKPDSVGEYIGENSEEVDVPIYPLTTLNYSSHDLSPDVAHTVVMPRSYADDLSLGYLGREEFINHPLAIARLGGTTTAQKYFDATNKGGSIYLPGTFVDEFFGSSGLLSLQDDNQPDLAGAEFRRNPVRMLVREGKKW